MLTFVPLSPEYIAMLFVRKIFFNNKPLILTNSASLFLNQNPAAVHFLLLKDATNKNYGIAQSYLKSPIGLGVLITDKNEENLMSILEENCTFITAAGGLVNTPTNKTLMIFRRGVWDLPKGKLDDGESINTCAIREVIEETGLPDKIEIRRKICQTYHIYLHETVDILKTTHWFEMYVKQEWTLHPQEEEGIVQASWIAEKELPHYLNESWANVREVLTIAKKL